jgi:ribonuclease HI
VSSVTTKYARK